MHQIIKPATVKIKTMRNNAHIVSVDDQEPDFLRAENEHLGNTVNTVCQNLRPIATHSPVPGGWWGLERRNVAVMDRGVAASRFLGRQELVACQVLVLTLGSMITIPMVWSM